MNHKRKKSTGGSSGGGKSYKAKNKLKQILKGIDVNLGDLPKMNHIPNKIKRSEVFARRKKAKNLIKSQNREKRKREEKLLGDKAPPKKIPKTIDDMKIPNETLVEKDDVEVEEDEKNDEFGEYFDEGKVPKILMTSSRRPSCELEKNIMALKKVFPRSTYVRRRNYYIKEICEYASQRSFTDVMVWREDEQFQIWELILIHLPYGPTATFRITHFLHPDKLENKGKPTKHRPEIILNGFTSRLGHTIGRMFASLFPQNPQFHGREVVTLHNQRDYIFFRFHRYEFENTEECNLQELGPSFTLRLRSLQKGTFDTKFGEYEYFWKTEQTVNRKKFYL